jgi:two-component system, chemotaxis family, protein-glutamate methylesterase/glutaminase
MNARPIRVLVVDDSAFARKVLREVLSASAGIEVVGFARDGLDALEQVVALQPDVVTLDLMMPNLDGVGVLNALATLDHRPRVVVVTVTDEASELGVSALQAGAFDVVHKPTSVATDELYQLAEELRAKVILAGTGAPPSRKPSGAAGLAGERRPGAPGVVVIGASTGGPQALTTLLRGLPADLPVPVAIALHMPVGYTGALARRLDGECALDVVEARDAMDVTKGQIVIARAGLHLVLERAGDGCRTRLEIKPLETPHRPAVDVLFASAASAFPGEALGVVLTGMGSDGLEGARAIRATGGRVLAESASSCVVYGMPRCIIEAGLANAEAPIERMVNLILAHL